MGQREHVSAGFVHALARAEGGGDMQRDRQHSGEAFASADGVLLHSYPH